MPLRVIQLIAKSAILMSMRLGKNTRSAITAIELLIATAVIVLDVWIPTLVVLAVIAVSFLVRKEKLSSIGLKKPENLTKMLATVLLYAFLWTAIQFALTTPLLNHLFGATQNLSGFENLKGNIGGFFYLLFTTWTLAAFGEEIVYRGFLQKRCRELLGNTKSSVLFAVGFSSVLFGLAHIEQGIVGFALTAIDAVFFSLLKLRFGDNLFASVLAHGFNNTIGIVAFFFIGPVYGLW